MTALDELVKLVERANALRNELDAIKGESPVGLFVRKLRRTLQHSDARRPAAPPAAPSSRHEGSRQAADLVDALRDAVSRLEGEREAIAAESALGLFVRRLFGKMPPPGALPVFSRERVAPRTLAARFVTRPTNRVLAKTGRLVLRRYRRWRVPPVDYPSITIVVPMLDGAETLGDAIRSVVAQDYPNLQVLIVDAGPAGGGRSVVERFGGSVEYVRSPEAALDRALAFGIARAAGEVVGCLATRDLLEPRALERIGRYFAARPRVDAIWSIDVIDVNGWRFPAAAPLLHNAFFRRNVNRVRRPVLVRFSGNVRTVRLADASRVPLPGKSAFRAGGDSRLSFPLDVRQVPSRPVVCAPISAEHPPVCPITGSIPDRVLFSSPDTCLGYDPISYAYYAPQAHLAIAYPRIDEDLLAERYERAAWSPQQSPLLPEGPSPYREYVPHARRLAASAAWWPSRSGRAAADESWADRALVETLDALRATGVPGDRAAAFLNIGYASAGALDRVRSATIWRVAGVDHARIADVGSAFALDARFDVVRIDGIERYNDPLAAVLAASTVMPAGGRLVFETPNLDSAQLDLFGPTWSGWRLPYHRYVFSVKALRLLAERANMRFIHHRTVSHPALTERSLLLRRYGLAAVLPDTMEVPAELRARAHSLCGWSGRLFDPRGRGDRIVAVFEKRG